MSLIPDLKKVYGPDKDAKLRADVEWLLGKSPDERRALRQQAQEAQRAARNRAAQVKRDAARRAAQRADIPQAKALASRITNRNGRHPEFDSDFTASEMAEFKRLSPAGQREVFRVAINARTRG